MFATSASPVSLRAISMKGSETSMPSASPPGPINSASRRVVSPKPQPRSTTRSLRRGGCAASAASPCAPSPPATRSRYCTKHSNSGPLQASVASRFSAAGAPIPSMVRPPGPLAILKRPPAANPVLAQLEQPAHLFLARRRAVLVPAPDPLDQRQRVSPTALGVILEQLLQLDCLLHPAGRASRPKTRGLRSLPQPLHRVQLNFRIEHSDEPIQIALVEGPDELTNGIVNHEGQSR